LVVAYHAQHVVSELPKFFVGSCVNSKNIGGWLAEIVCRSRSSVRTVCGIMCRSQNNVWIGWGIEFGRV